jgi:hypothetical protein
LLTGDAVPELACLFNGLFLLLTELIWVAEGLRCILLEVGRLFGFVKLVKEELWLTGRGCAGLLTASAAAAAIRVACANWLG